LTRDLIREKLITFIRDGARMERNEIVTVEAALTIFVNGTELVTLLCTPADMDRLALGFLRSEGFLTSLDDLESLRLQEEECIVEIELKNSSDLARSLYGKRTITSGCGKGTTFYHALDALRSKPVSSELRLKSSQIHALMRALEDRAQLFKQTGGIHSAALANGAEILMFFEDIGRHNAVDKIVGQCLLERMEMSDKSLVVSGRLSSEILLKAAKLQLPVLISRAAPTSLSIELAESLNITMVGFARGRRMNIYSHAWRIETA